MSKKDSKMREQYTRKKNNGVALVIDFLTYPQQRVLSADDFKIGSNAVRDHVYRSFGLFSLTGAILYFGYNYINSSSSKSLKNFIKPKWIRYGLIPFAAISVPFIMSSNEATKKLDAIYKKYNFTYEDYVELISGPSNQAIQKNVYA